MNVEGITILEDVRIGIAANVVAQICNINVGPVVVLGRAVDSTDVSDSICFAPTEDAPEVVITDD